MEIQPCRACSAQEPWAAVLVREDAQADQLTQKLDYTASHDTLTGLLNRARYENDLHELSRRERGCITCVYIDAIGLHEVNNHLGHRKGDELLCSIADAARQSFDDSRIYRIGGDEFVVLAPGQTRAQASQAVGRMRRALRTQGAEFSAGLACAEAPSMLLEALNDAEIAMRLEKQEYYRRGGRRRQLRGLNEQLERILSEKRDAEHFLRVIGPQFKTVFIADMSADCLRCIFEPEQFRNALEQTGGSLKATLEYCCRVSVAPEWQARFARLYDFEFLRRHLLSNGLYDMTYRNNEGHRVGVRVIRDAGANERETLWIFFDMDADPPPDLENDSSRTDSNPIK